MKKKYKMKNCEDLAPLKETLKQNIQLKAQIIRRYYKRSKFYRQNKTFKMEKKKFYIELGKTQVTVEKLPSKEEVEKFWTSIRVQRRNLMKKLNGSNDKKNDVKV